MTNPAADALHDQAAAAARDAADAMNTVAANRGYQTGHSELAGPAAAVIAQLGERLTAGTVTFCPHVNITAPRPRFWIGQRPGRIRCGDCIRATIAHLADAKERPRCDHCRQNAPVLHPWLVQDPGVVVENGHQAAASGPLIARFWLCANCHTASLPDPPQAD